MIDSLHIENFQSHESTRLEFVRGINAIVGDSDSGKSATLRALLNCIDNRNAEVDPYASKWVRKKNKQGVYEGFKPKGFYRITVAKDGKECTRIRSTEENGYRITGRSDLVAIGKKLPQEVESFFNLTSTNIQTQQDPQFIISKGGGEIARYFNQVLKLEKIDAQLSAATSLRLEAMRDVESAQGAVKDTQAKLLALDWVDTIGEALDKLKAMESRSMELGESLTSLQGQIYKYQELTKVQDIAERATRLGPALRDLDMESHVLGMRSGKLGRLAESMEQYQAQSKCLYSMDSLRKIGTTFHDISAKVPKVTKLLAEIPKNVELEAFAKAVKIAGIKIPEVVPTATLLAKKYKCEVILENLVPEVSRYSKSSRIGMTTLPSLEPLERLERKRSRYAEGIIYLAFDQYQERQLACSHGEAILQELQAQMPNMCPFCNSPLHKVHP